MIAWMYAVCVWCVGLCVVCVCVGGVCGGACVRVCKVKVIQVVVQCINNSRSPVNFRAICLLDRPFNYLLGHSVLACKD